MMRRALVSGAVLYGDNGIFGSALGFRSFDAFLRHWQEGERASATDPTVFMQQSAVASAAVNASLDRIRAEFEGRDAPLRQILLAEVDSWHQTPRWYAFLIVVQSFPLTEDGEDFEEDPDRRPKDAVFWTYHDAAGEALDPIGRRLGL